MPSSVLATFRCAVDDRDVGDGVHPVGAGGDRRDAALDRDEAGIGVVGVVGLQSVAARGDGDGAAVDHQVVLAPDAVVGGLDGDRAAADHQPVLAGDPVVAVPVHGRARPTP